MVLKRVLLICASCFLLFVKCIKCGPIGEYIPVLRHADVVEAEQLSQMQKKENKDLSKNIPFEALFRKGLQKQVENNYPAFIFNKALSNWFIFKKSSEKWENDIKTNVPPGKSSEQGIQEVKETQNIKQIKRFNIGSIRKNIPLKIRQRSKNNAMRTTIDVNSNDVAFEQLIHMKEKNDFAKSGNNNDGTNDEGVITERMVKESKHICNRIMVNPFGFSNVANIHNSAILKLFKKPLEDGETGEYDLFGVGEMKDVSAAVLNEAINNITNIKQWNKFIKELTYVNISKEYLLQKKKENQMLNVNDHVVKEKQKNGTPKISTEYSTGVTAADENSEFFYLVNQLPWPLKNQDVVYEKYNNYDEKTNMFLVINKSVDNLFMANENFTRIKNYKHFFCIYPQTGDFSKKGLKYVIYFYYNADIPKYVQMHLFRQLIPSLIFNLHAYAQRESNKQIPFIVNGVLQKNKAVPIKELNRTADPVSQPNGLKKVKYEKMETAKKQNMPEEKKTEGKSKESGSKSHRSICFFKECFFKRLRNLWKNKTENFEKLFFFFYYLF